MTDTPEPTPPPAAPRSGVRRWMPTYTQFRLTILMLALTFGITGMVRNDRYLLDAGIVIAMIGVAMRFLRKNEPPRR